MVEYHHGLWDACPIKGLRDGHVRHHVTVPFSFALCSM